LVQKKNNYCYRNIDVDKHYDKQIILYWEHAAVAVNLHNILVIYDTNPVCYVIIGSAERLRHKSRSRNQGSTEEQKHGSTEARKHGSTEARKHGSTYLYGGWGMMTEEDNDGTSGGRQR
jgi:hypothetical protein